MKQITALLLMFCVSYTVANSVVQVPQSVKDALAKLIDHRDVKPKTESQLGMFAIPNSHVFVRSKA